MLPREMLTLHRSTLGGSAAYHERATHLRPGPQTVADFGRWPEDLAKSLAIPRASDASSSAAQARIHRLVNILGGGLVVHTDFKERGWAELDDIKYADSKKD